MLSLLIARNLLELLFMGTQGYDAGCSQLAGFAADGTALLGLLFAGTADKVDGALCILLITFRFSAIFLVISGKRYIFAEKSNV